MVRFWVEGMLLKYWSIVEHFLAWVCSSKGKLGCDLFSTREQTKASFRSETVSHLYSSDSEAVGLGSAEWKCPGQFHWSVTGPLLFHEGILSSLNLCRSWAFCHNLSLSVFVCASALLCQGNSFLEVIHHFWFYSLSTLSSNVDPWGLRGGVGYRHPL